MQCWSMEPSAEGGVCTVTLVHPIKLTLYWHEEKCWITIQHPAQFDDIAVTYIENDYRHIAGEFK